jgi:hypothetical protein
MRRTLYGVIRDTNDAAAQLREEGVTLTPDIQQKLGRFEAAMQHALASSPDGETIAQAEELVALDALCDLHLALQQQPERLRAALRPVVDDWISYAVSTGATPEELASRSSSSATPAAIDSWLDRQGM